MINYITFTEPNENEEMEYFILQKLFPHLLCKILEMPIVNVFQPVPINEYDLYIIFNGTLRGLQLPSYKNIGDEIKDVMHDMADWFYNNRILKNEKKYKKWKQQKIT